MDGNCNITEILLLLLVTLLITAVINIITVTSN